MPELFKIKKQVVNAALDHKEKYIKVADWSGKSLTLILANEIGIEDKPTLPEQNIKKN